MHAACRTESPATFTSSPCRNATLQLAPDLGAQSKGSVASFCSNSCSTLSQHVAQDVLFSFDNKLDVSASGLGRPAMKCRCTWPWQTAPHLRPLSGRHAPQRLREHPAVAQHHVSRLRLAPEPLQGDALRQVAAPGTKASSAWHAALLFKVGRGPSEPLPEPGVSGATRKATRCPKGPCPSPVQNTREQQLL